MRTYGKASLFLMRNDIDDTDDNVNDYDDDNGIDDL